MKPDKFVVAILLTVAIAYVFPRLGEDAANVLDWMATVGVGLVFFLYGVKLSLSEIKVGLSNWRLHLVVQLTTFLVFPLIVWACYPMLANVLQEDLWVGFLFLAALPSTVSSSVVMVGIARGNVPAAIFNASISGLIGIVLTPLWMGQTLKGAEGLGDLYLRLVVEILVPLLLGLSLQKWLRPWVMRNSSGLSWFDKSVILLIIYKSFARSFEEGIFDGIGWTKFVLIGLGITILFVVVYYWGDGLAKLLRFPVEDKITLQFCGTKKSLVHASVFAKVLFGTTASMAMILLPIMIYHAFQILVIGVLAERYAGREF